MNRRQLQQLMKVVRRYDIGENSDPMAIFDPGNNGAGIWVTPDQHPDDSVWESLIPEMNAGSFTKPCMYLGSFYVEWDDDVIEIVGIRVETEPHELQDSLRIEKFANRPIDLNWAKVKVRWIFETANIPCPPLLDHSTPRESREPVEVDWEVGADFTELDQFDLNELPANAPMNEKWYWGVIVDGELRVRTMQGQSLIVEIQPTGYRSAGFSTGYLGSGCAETAMVMLSDYFGETITKDSARGGIGKGAHAPLYQQFKEDIIASLPQNTPFVVTATEIAAWLEAHTDLIPPESDDQNF